MNPYGYLEEVIKADPKLIIVLFIGQCHPLRWIVQNASTPISYNKTFITSLIHSHTISNPLPSSPPVLAGPFIKLLFPRECGLPLNFCRGTLREVHPINACGSDRPLPVASVVWHFELKN